MLFRQAALLLSIAAAAALSPAHAASYEPHGRKLSKKNPPEPPQDTAYGSRPSEGALVTSDCVGAPPNLSHRQKMTQNLAFDIVGVPQKMRFSKPVRLLVEHVTRDGAILADQYVRFVDGKMTFPFSGVCISEKPTGSGILHLTDIDADCAGLSLMANGTILEPSTGRCVTLIGFNGQAGNGACDERVHIVNSKKRDPAFPSFQDALAGNWNEHLIWDCGGPGGMAHTMLEIKLMRCEQPATFWFNPMSPRCPAHMNAVDIVDPPTVNEPVSGTFD